MKFLYLFENHLKLSDQLIFFSYSRQDGVEFALKLASDLRNRGANTWIDKENIPDGADWVEEIENAMTNAVYVLYILTADGNKSSNVRNEILYAKDENKKLIPLKIDSKCKPPLYVRTFQYVDFATDYSAGLNRLSKTLNLQAKTADYSIKIMEKSTLKNKTISEKRNTEIKIAPNNTLEKAASKQIKTPAIKNKISKVDSEGVKNKFNSQAAINYVAYLDPVWWILLALVTGLSIICTYYASQLFNNLLENFQLQNFQYQLSRTMIIITGSCWGLAYALTGGKNAITRKDIFLGVSSPFLNILIPDDFSSVIKGLFSSIFISTFITMFTSGILAIANKNAFSFGYSTGFLIAFISINVFSLFIFLMDD